MPPLGVLAFVVTFVAWASYIPVAKSPKLRHSMWPTWVLQAIALALAAFALLAQPRVVALPMILGIVALASVALFVLVYATALRIPQSQGRPEEGKSLPHLSLVSETGAAISPDDYSGKGPLLMVFFRGFW
ncbi:MAG TPA: hypothetical protein VEJ63_22130 [Planctomycetota bacterium]|nr:hypothetical protein [Planctomycetota bacterium]